MLLGEDVSNSRPLRWTLDSAEPISCHYLSDLSNGIGPSQSQTNAILGFDLSCEEIRPLLDMKKVGTETGTLYLATKVNLRLEPSLGKEENLTLVTSSEV